MLRSKGKYASATNNRRLVWKQIVWPLILETNSAAFSLEQFQEKRNQVIKAQECSISDASRGLVSLVRRGILRREEKIYSVHYRLIPYMRMNAECDYATAINESRMK